MNDSSPILDALELTPHIHEQTRDRKIPEDRDPQIEPDYRSEDPPRSAVLPRGAPSQVPDVAIEPPRAAGPRLVQ